MTTCVGLRGCKNGKNGPNRLSYGESTRGVVHTSRRNIIRKMGLEHETSFDGFLTPKRDLAATHTACIRRATRDAQETPNEGVPEHVRRRINGPRRYIPLVRAPNISDT